MTLAMLSLAHLNSFYVVSTPIYGKQREQKTEEYQTFLLDIRDAKITSKKMHN